MTLRLLLVLAVAGAVLWLNRRSIDPAPIEGAIRDLGVWAPLGHIVLFALAAVLFVPGAIFGLAGGVGEGNPRSIRALRIAKLAVPSWSVSFQTRRV